MHQQLPEHQSLSMRLILGIGILLLLVISTYLADDGGKQATAQTIPAPATQIFLPVISVEPAATPSYEFNVGAVERCDPNAGITYVNGTVAKGGVPFNGALVAFSYAEDGPIVAQIASGPHEGYPNWPDGFFSHILGTGGPRAGEWYFWIVDEQDQRISVTIHLHTDSEAGEGMCQQGVLHFDREE
ncbi:MAG: hypothetical protein R3C14_39330 [Caldilineaceae bacterium]